MESFRRIITLLLAFVMVLSMVVSTFASVIELEPVSSTVVITYKNGTDEKSKKYEIKTDEKGSSIKLCKWSDVKWKKEGCELTGWKIGGSTYELGKTFSFDKSKYAAETSGKYEGEYHLIAEAVWETDDSSSEETVSGKIVVTYKPGSASYGNKFKETYSKEYEKKKEYYIVTFPKADKFDVDKKSFVGWIIEGDSSNKIYKAGDEIATNKNFTAIAQWDNKVVIGDSSSSASGSGSSSSGSSSSAPASSGSSSSASASSSPSSSASVPEESSSEPEVPEQPEDTPEFEPITLEFEIDGDVPVSKIKFDVNEDIGGVPSLSINAIDNNSTSDATTMDFISAGNALAAFDISMLRDGEEYAGSVNGVLTYELNGTQATAVSNFEEYVLAMVHVIDANKFEGGSYYAVDENKVYLYDTVSGKRSKVGGINLVENNGIYRPVITDANAFGTFAYQSKEGTIVEVKPLADMNADSVSMDVTSFSPFMLVHLEKGEASAKSGGFPIWIIIVIVVIVLLAAAAVAVFFFMKSKGKFGKKTEDAAADSGEDGGTNITGLD